MKLPVLVDCVPYQAKLPAASCIDRWEKAQTVVADGKGVGNGNRAVRNGARRGALSECVHCEVGKRRAEEAAAAKAAEAKAAKV